MKVSGLNVCLLNLANKCHPAKASGYPLAFASSVLTGEGPLEGSGEGRAWEQVHSGLCSVPCGLLGLRIQIILMTVCSLVVVTGPSGL